jgi:hypothetical protein
MGELPDTSPIGLDCPNGKRLQFDVTFLVFLGERGRDQERGHGHRAQEVQQSHRILRDIEAPAVARSSQTQNTSPVGGNTRFSVHGRHKHSEPASNMSWHDSPHQQSGTPGQSLRIGWEDGGDQVDGDYDDALVNVTWL